MKAVKALYNGLALKLKEQTRRLNGAVKKRLDKDADAEANVAVLDDCVRMNRYQNDGGETVKFEDLTADERKKVQSRMTRSLTPEQIEERLGKHEKVREQIWWNQAEENTEPAAQRTIDPLWGDGHV